MNKLLKAATNVAALMKAIIELNDRVASAASPLDMQGELLRLHNSLTKNRPRVVKLVDELCDMVEAETGEKVE
jgi:hypothetical protein